MDHYAYQEGLLISYWNTRWADNNTVRTGHPGEGRNLYIDAHPRPIYNLTGAPVAGPRPGVRRAVQPEEGGLVHAAPQQPAAVHPWPGRAAAVRRHQEVLVYEELPNHGVKLPATGIKIKVLEQDGTSMKIRVC